MLNRSLLRRAIVLGVAAFAAGSVPTAEAQIPSLRERTRDLERHDGFFPFYWDAGEGKLLLEVPADRRGQEFLYLTSQATGVGSVQLGLDRGRIGDEAVVRLERVGPKLLLVQRNLGFRAVDTENKMLVRSVEESFPTSILGAFEIAAEEGGTILVDATDFFLRDAMDIKGSLERAGQGTFRLDASRSAIYLPRTKAFPKNTEIEVTLTFASDNPGPEVRRHSPEGRSLTLREHHSLVELPPPGYRPRAFDPRVGVFALRFEDFARPLTEQYARQWVVRWRLEKKNPEAAVSEPKKPIVYYLDRGIPEPYRSAFREGAMWWNEVLEAAGFRNAFQVSDLPEDADPLDARYSVIQWVHRTEPGFSIGPSFVDPRTGEIIKAAVRMDSYRSLVDFNIWAGASPATSSGGNSWDRCEFAGATTLPDWIAALDQQTDPVDFAMARRRQHAAHEVGHTLGLAHNFIASTYGRASVMDYPPPRVLIRNGKIDLSEAYRPGPGAYDSLAIRYAYTPFPDGREADGLREIVREALDEGILFLTDIHARPAGASDPRATLWDDGAEPVAAFREAVAVRKILLASFSDHAVEPGEPLALLRDRLAPVYLYHRYAMDVAARTIGGMEIAYALRGDGQTPTRIIEPARQWAALELMVGALAPDELLIPESVLGLLAPYPFGYAAPRRGFDSAAEPAFDQLGAARTLAGMIVDRLLQRQRAARLVAFSARQPDAPSLDDVISTLIERTWGAPAATGAAAAVQRVAQRAVVDGLIDLASDSQATVDVRAIAEWDLEQLASRIADAEPSSPAARAHARLALRDTQRFLNRTSGATPRTEPLAPPPGSPISDRTR